MSPQKSALQGGLVVVSVSSGVSFQGSPAVVSGVFSKVGFQCSLLVVRVPLSR